MARTPKAPANKESAIDPEILAELEATDGPNETARSIDEHIEDARELLLQNQRSRDRWKLAYEINKEIGWTMEELAEIIRQFTLARNAVKQLLARIERLEQEQETRQPQTRPATTA